MRKKTKIKNMLPFVSALLVWILLMLPLGMGILFKVIQNTQNAFDYLPNACFFLIIAPLGIYAIVVLTGNKDMVRL